MHYCPFTDPGGWKVELVHRGQFTHKEVTCQSEIGRYNHSQESQLFKDRRPNKLSYAAVF